ncbi:NAD-dependent epimerase/dehydratase family protein [Paludibaculum fermentans]|uniref:GDP-mannose 4,6-dehydratase n=1 Tax=Paludibaculum fermentans TaxID=1473598 RepID=A0A7S7NM48_PALFE|nr:NAD-dependent epimerase/dehydratase family protein [Paludibaculum fermentans]QOY86128.1 GDP-mannose 4,6-dehydratase [Paludibaculum fermentans]
MRVLVTGGAGFIGSHLCSRLLRGGHAAAILDDLNDYYDPALKQRNLEEVRACGPVLFQAGEICDLAAVERLMGEFRPEAVVHLAARVGVRPSLTEPLLYQRVNVEGTAVVLECARRCGVERFIFASSSSVYGTANRVPFSEDDTLLRPMSPYAATKIAGEALCHSYAHLYGLKTTCLRFFTVYGPRQRPDLAIRRFVENISAGRPIPVFGDGGTGRDYTYVDDIVDGIVRALGHDHGFEIYNLGNSQPVLLRDMIATLERVLGREALIDRQPMQPGDMLVTCASIEKARRDLGYEPATTFEAGIRATAEWLCGASAS